MEKMIKTAMEKMINTAGKDSRSSSCTPLIMV